MVGSLDIDIVPLVMSAAECLWFSSAAPMFSGVIPKLVRAFAALVAPVPPRVIGAFPM